MKIPDNFKVVVIGDGQNAANLANHIESHATLVRVEFIASPMTYDQPVAGWLAKESKVIETADWLIVGIHSNLNEAKAVLQGIHRLAPEAVLWNSLACSTATEATVWLHGDTVFGWSQVESSGASLELSAPLHRASKTEGLGIPAPFIETWEHLAGVSVAEIVDSPGGVQARVVHCIINEAATALKEQVCTPEDLDEAMKLGVNYPLGPLEWANKIGLDTVLSTMECLYRNYREERYRPAPLLRDMAMAQASFNVKPK